MRKLNTVEIESVSGGNLPGSATVNRLSGFDSFEFVNVENNLAFRQQQEIERAFLAANPTFNIADFRGY